MKSLILMATLVLSANAFAQSYSAKCSDGKYTANLDVRKDSDVDVAILEFTSPAPAENDYKFYMDADVSTQRGVLKYFAFSGDTTVTMRIPEVQMVNGNRKANVEVDYLSLGFNDTIYFSCNFAD